MVSPVIDIINDDTFSYTRYAFSFFFFFSLNQIKCINNKHRRMSIVAILYLFFVLMIVGQIVGTTLGCVQLGFAFSLVDTKRSIIDGETREHGRTVQNPCDGRWIIFHGQRLFLPIGKLRRTNADMGR